VVLESKEARFCHNFVKILTDLQYSFTV